MTKTHTHTHRHSNREKEREARESVRERERVREAEGFPRLRRKDHLSVKRKAEDRFYSGFIKMSREDKKARVEYTAESVVCTMD